MRPAVVVRRDTSGALRHGRHPTATSGAEVAAAGAAAAEVAAAAVDVAAADAAAGAADVENTAGAAEGLHFTNRTNTLSAAPTTATRYTFCSFAVL